VPAFVARIPKFAVKPDRSNRRKFIRCERRGAKRDNLADEPAIVTTELMSPNNGIVRFKAHRRARWRPRSQKPYPTSDAMTILWQIGSLPDPGGFTLISDIREHGRIGNGASE
jgi:hypothetical protein